MLFPFMEIMFVGLTLWSQWFPIPGISDPQESLLRRSIGSLRLTLDVGAIYVLVDGPGYATPTGVSSTDVICRPSRVYSLPRLPTPSPVPILTRAYGRLTASRPKECMVYLAPSLRLKNTSLIDWMTAFFIFLQFVLLDLLSSKLPLLLWLLYHITYVHWHVTFLITLIDFIAHTLRYLCDRTGFFVYIFIGQPQIARMHFVVDRSLSVYELTDLLIAGPNEANLDPNFDARTISMNLLVSVLSQAEDIWIHREVLKYIQCKEVEAMFGQFQELDCIRNGPIDPVTNVTPQSLVSLAARNSSDVNQETEYPDPDHLPARLWALAPWHPKHLSPFMVSHLVGALLASWKEGNKDMGISGAPVDVPRSSDTAFEMEKGHSDTDDDDVSTLVRPKRKNRLSQRTRRRHGKQAARRREEELAQTPAECTGTVSSSSGPSLPSPLASTPLVALAPALFSSPEETHQQNSGPPSLTPVPEKSDTNLTMDSDSTLARAATNSTDELHVPLTRRLRRH
ncbi:hypothetical protein PENANT_c006G05139 [Penicillium antarcticum]|uniref:Uncharacterized protein n=1 Tax=Penicillium antarcticum TaxID=416450 RepID=A0A1V6QDM4_9EURO|nr:hypothetical protein PENANT_c006G05139 [Penicillium antarcticum]